jgi:glycosyltransferase involved in cell wall biosynthesis
MANFSVIIPAYNNLQLFERAIQTVINQKYVIFEIIVVDDSTCNEIEQYIETLQDSRIRYYHNKPLLGAVRNWNYGLSLANGTYCMLLHHDESLHDELHLKKCLDKLLQNYDCVISNIKVHIKDEIKNGLCPDIVKRIVLKYPANLIALNLIGPTACVVFNRNLLQYFDENLCWFVDSEWYYRILKNKRICYLNNLYVSSLHGHKGQITNQINIIEKEHQDAKIIQNKYRSIVINAVFVLRKFIQSVKKLK